MENELKVKGKITHVLPLQSGTSKSGNEWKKQEFVIETNESYPKEICFTLFGDKVDAYGFDIEVGALVEVSFDVESREWNGRWFTECRAYKLTFFSTAAPQAPAQPAKAPVPDNDTPF